MHTELFPYLGSVQLSPDSLVEGADLSLVLGRLIVSLRDGNSMSPSEPRLSL